MLPRTDYRERAPMPRLASYVECVWSHGPSPLRSRVVPDTCIDLVFSRQTGLQIVGSMTHALLVESSVEPFVGVRLRAGAARSVIGLAVEKLRDEVLPACDVWDKRGRLMEERLRNAPSPDAGMQILESSLTPVQPLSHFQEAIAYLAANGGRICLERVIRSTGLGARQFRRRCLEETGLTPRHLARIGRFRNAWLRIARATRLDWAELALESGYYDQAHFINDFHEFSGLTPNAYWRELTKLTVSSNTSPAA